jgi:malonyl CoA-acyl carrier protein transacylase
VGDVLDATPTAAVFPGQGSQTKDMRDLVAVHRPDLLDQVTAACGSDPFARVAESTAFAQPAIFCASLVGWGAWEGPAPVALAGHSLGELTALVAAGVLTEADGLRLAVERGRLMAQAGEQAGGGSMLALLGATATQARRLAAVHDLTVANDNAPGQQVLSGAPDALAAAGDAARADGLKALDLDVAGAFHSPQMAGAEAGLREVLSSVELREPQLPVLCCATATEFTDQREELALALTRPVRWRETLLALQARGARHIVDVGPGRVLAKLVKRNLPDVSASAVEVGHVVA